MGNLMLVLLMFVGLFLMIVVLLQRGRGGGLAGAFGGLGGQSAFGTKAGDIFTVITIVTAFVWVVLACLTGWRLRVEAGGYYAGREEKAEVAPETPAEKKAEGAGAAGETKPDGAEKPAIESEAKDGPSLTPPADSKDEAKKEEGEKKTADEPAPESDEPAKKEADAKEPEAKDAEEKKPEAKESDAKEPEAKAPEKTEDAPKPATEAPSKEEPKPDAPKADEQKADDKVEKKE